jgi:hypothetical protein
MKLKTEILKNCYVESITLFLQGKRKLLLKERVHKLSWILKLWLLQKEYQHS